MVGIENWGRSRGGGPPNLHSRKCFNSRCIWAPAIFRGPSPEGIRGKANCPSKKIAPRNILLHLPVAGISVVLVLVSAFLYNSGGQGPLFIRFSRFLPKMTDFWITELSDIYESFGFLRGRGAPRAPPLFRVFVSSETSW